MEKNYDVTIIGAGIIGLNIAYYLSRYKLKILIIEKNPWVADETSHGNGGLIHGGFDAKGKIEAKLNIEGTNIWKNELLKKLTIPFQDIFTIVLGFNDQEMIEISKLLKRGIKNKLNPNDLKIVNKEQIQKLEPYITDKVVGGLICTSSVYVDPVSACRAMLGVAIKNQAKLIKNSEVTNLKENNQGFKVEINNFLEIQSKCVINAAGHYADYISKMAKQKKFDLAARRGEMRILSRSENFKVNNVLFKVPTIYGKGVGVAPRLDGRVIVGPTAEENINKEDTRLVTKKQYDYIGQVGHDIIPSLNLERTERIFSGSRPIYKETNDFLIDNSINKNFISIAGTQSPAFSASPAIALEVIKMIKNANLKLEKKKIFNEKYEIFF